MQTWSESPTYLQGDFRGLLVEALLSDHGPGPLSEGVLVRQVVEGVGALLEVEGAHGPHLGLVVVLEL